MKTLSKAFVFMFFVATVSCQPENIEPSNNSNTEPTAPCLQSVMHQKWGTKESIDIINGVTSEQWAELIEFRQDTFIKYRYQYTVPFDTLINTNADYGQAPSYVDTSSTCNSWVYVPSNAYTHYLLDEDQGDSIEIYHSWYGNSSMNFEAWYYKFP